MRRTYLADSARAALLAAAYVATARLGLSLGAVHGVASAVWPPTGIALAALLLFGYRLWPGIALGAVLANVSVGVPLVASFGIGIGNTLEAVCGAYLLHRCGFRASLQRLQDVFALVVLAALLSTLVSATIGTASAWLAGQVPAERCVTAWLTWWIGDAMGALLVTPLLLTWSTSSGVYERDHRYAETVILLGMLAVACAVIFGQWQRPAGWLVFPFVVWAALRLGQRGTTATALLASAVAVWGTIRGSGPFVGTTLSESLAWAQVFMGVVSVTGLVLAAVMAERQRAEGALRQGVERFHALIDKSHDAIVLIDAGGTVVYASPSAARIHGAPLQVGSSLIELVHHQERERLWATLTDLMAVPGRVVTTEHRLQRLDGSWRWVEGCGTNLLADPRVGAIVANYRDITERKEAEAALRSAHDELERRVSERTAELHASNEALSRQITERERAELAVREGEERLRLLLRNVRDYAIVMLDPSGRVTSWNAGAEHIKGYAATEIIGRHFSIFYPSDDVKRGRPERALRLAAETGRYEEEAWRVRKDGSPFWASVVMSALRDEHGELQGFAKVTRDITERKETEHRMAELSSRLLTLQDEERRRIGRELHDSTAQNLAGAAMNLALVQRAATRLGDGMQRALAESVALVDQCSREVRTLSYLLHPPLLDEMGLASAIRWYADGFAERSGVAVSVDIAADLGRLPQEVETALFRIVQECLTNVHRHAASPSVRIEIYHDRATLMLRVQDWGRGIASANLKALAGGNGHFGVGIMGMRERMRQLGGLLEISSSDAGTIVTASLPRGAAREYVDVDRKSEQCGHEDHSDPGGRRS